MAARTEAQRIAVLVREGGASNIADARSRWHKAIEDGADLLEFAAEVEDAIRTWPYFDGRTDVDLEAAAEHEGNSK